MDLLARDWLLQASPQQGSATDSMPAALLVLVLYSVEFPAVE